MGLQIFKSFVCVGSDLRGQPTRVVVVMAEPGLDQIVSSAVACMEVSKNPVGDDVRHLDESRCLRVEEQRDFGEISESAATMPYACEQTRQILQLLFVVTLVKYDKPSLGISLALIQGVKVAIEGDCNILKALSDDSFRIRRRFLYDRSKHLQLQLMIGKKSKHIGNDLRTFLGIHAFPRFSSSVHHATVKLDVFRIRRVYTLGDAIKLAFQPIGLALENAEACQDKKVGARITRMSRFVEVKQMHFRP